MAINIISYPESDYYQSVHDDLWVIVESDNSSQVDFKYVFDIYVGGVQLIRAKIYPDPKTGLGYFNMSNVLSNEIKYNWFKCDNAYFVNYVHDSDDGKLFLRYNVKIGEEANGVTTTNMESVEGIVVNCTPNLYGRYTEDSRTYFYQRWLSYQQPTELKYKSRFLTDRDRKTTTGFFEQFFIPVYLREQNQQPYLQVTKYFNNGNTSSEILAYFGDFEDYGEIEDFGVAQLNISPQGINQILNTNFIDSNVVKYIVSILDWNGSSFQRTDEIELTIDCKQKYESINLHFMNNYGLFDTARFNLASRLSMDVERKTFQTNDYDLSAENFFGYYDTSNLSENTSYTQYKENKINYGSKYQWSYKLTMNFPSDADYEWLDQLIMSPQIWLEKTIYYNLSNNTNKEFYAISIKANNYEYSKHINNRLRAFEIEVDMNQKRHGFRR